MPIRVLASQLSIRLRFLAVEHPGDLALAMSGFLQGVNLVSFFSGEAGTDHQSNINWPVKRLRGDRSYPARPVLFKIALHS
ncbi:hypothetical protein [Ferrigenium sp. UT5]|uniref:hypothetical protein n=1 Tax=Ferrigenium sp. UT5 TaxID=3242105 RepID=UPI0038B2C8F3